MRRFALFGLLTLSAFLGCADSPRPEIHGTIINVYSEIRIGESDGTTIVQTDDGRIYKYAGKLGKKGDKISLSGINVLR